MYVSPFKASATAGAPATRPLRFRAALSGLLLGFCFVRTASAQADPAQSPEPTRSDASAHRTEDGAQDEVAAKLKPPELQQFVAARPGPGAPPIVEAHTVVLGLTVKEDGSVENVEIVRSADPELDRAAAEAASQFRFSPAEVEGKPVAVRIQYEYVYEPEVAPATATDQNVNAAKGEEASAARGAAETETRPAAPAAVAGPRGRLEGQLLESGTRRAIVGARIFLPRLGREALTDGEGRFSFADVPTGEVELEMTDTSHATIHDTESVRANVATEVTYYAEQTGFGEDDLVAVASKPKKLVVQRELAIREIETVPGSNGDALHAVQNLPGVARSYGDQIVMRGGGASQVLVNGHPVSTAFHFGGLRSTVGNGMLESLEVTPGNYDARYGRANGGIIDIQTRRPATDGLHGYGQVDVFDASAFLEGPVGDHGAFALGARRSWIDGVMNLVLDDEAKETFATAPRYYDYQGSYDWKRGPHRVRLNAFGASDRMVLMMDEPAESDPAVRGSFDYSLKWVTGQALWDYRISDKTQLSTGVSYLHGKVHQSIGDDLDLTFVQDQVTLRSDLSHEVEPWLRVRAGVDATVQRIPFDVVAPYPPTEGEPQPNLSTQPIMRTDGVATDYQPAAYVATELTLGPVLLIPALRAEHFSRPDTLRGTSLLQPRFDARWAVTDATSLKAGVGMFSEPLDIDKSNSVFGNPNLEPVHSIQYSAGAEQRITDALSLDVTGFYKDLRNNVSRVDDPAIRYTNDGRGRIYGTELLLKHELRSRFSGWIAYTLSRSERLDAGATEYRLFDLDQTHNLNIVGQYRLSPTWEVGARFRYVSGNPTTPVVGSVYDSDADTYSPVYGAVNSDRLDSFHQLDVRVDKHFIFDTWKLTAYLDVQNAYNRKNPEGMSFNYDYSESKPIAGLPIIPSFGVKGAF